MKINKKLIGFVKLIIFVNAKIVKINKEDIVKLIYDIHKESTVIIKQLLNFLFVNLFKIKQ